MKTISVCVAFLLAGLYGEQSSAPQTSEVTATRMLDAAIAIVKAHALQRDRIVWPEIEPKLREMVGSATLAADRCGRRHRDFGRHAVADLIVWLRTAALTRARSWM